MYKTKIKFVYSEYYDGFESRVNDAIEQLEKMSNFKEIESIQYVITKKSGAFSALITAKFGENNGL